MEADVDEGRLRERVLDDRVSEVATPVRWAGAALKDVVGMAVQCVDEKEGGG